MSVKPRVPKLGNQRPGSRAGLSSSLVSHAEKLRLRHAAVAACLLLAVVQQALSQTMFAYSFSVPSLAATDPTNKSTVPAGSMEGWIILDKSLDVLAAKIVSQSSGSFYSESYERRVFQIDTPQQRLGPVVLASRIQRPRGHIRLLEILAPGAPMPDGGFVSDRIDSFDVDVTEFQPGRSGSAALPATGGTRSGVGTLRRLRCEELLRPDRFKIEGYLQNGACGVKMIYTPGHGLSPEAAAAVCGAGAFNFSQQIVRMPQGAVYPQADGTKHTPENVSEASPVFDPPEGGWGWLGQKATVGLFPYYRGLGWIHGRDLALVNYRTGTTLQFNDAPSSSPEFIPTEHDFIGFRTWMVKVPLRSGCKNTPYRPAGADLTLPDYCADPLPPAQSKSMASTAVWEMRWAFHKTFIHVASVNGDEAAGGLIGSDSGCKFVPLNLGSRR